MCVRADRKKMIYAPLGKCSLNFSNSILKNMLAVAFAFPTGNARTEWTVRAYEISATNQTQVQLSNQHESVLPTCVVALSIWPLTLNKSSPQSNECHFNDSFILYECTLTAKLIIQNRWILIGKSLSFRCFPTDRGQQER